MEIAVRVLAFLAGTSLVVTTLLSAVRTCVLPRGVPTLLSRSVFLTMRRVVGAFAGPRATYERRDRVMAYYAPVSLFAMLATWLLLVFVGYASMYWALGASVRQAFFASGSSLFTLGFAEPSSIRMTVLVFSEAGIGLLLLALLIAFMPSLYSAYSRREVQVTKLAVRAGQPASGVNMMLLAADLGWVEHVENIGQRWIDYQDWFADILETHQSYPALTFFRSPQSDRSWITAAGAVLDGTALRSTVIDGPRDIEARFCLETGVLALHEISHFFRMPHGHEEDAGEDHITITRAEFDVAYDRFDAAGIQLRPRDEAWQDFARARARYDSVLIMLCRLIDAPAAPWSSDRSTEDWKPTLRTRADAHAQHRHDGE